MPRTLTVGTRNSELALWQTQFVCDRLHRHKTKTIVKHITSDGEADTTTPLYEMGVTGVFTRSLDSALLDGRIDIAVHSLKDIPTVPAEGIVIAAVLEREVVSDMLISRYKVDNFQVLSDNRFTVATSSLRRRAQWLHRYPHHTIEDLRGNINTRLRKLEDSTTLDAIILASAGVKRIGLPIPHGVQAEWLLPAPGQGALAITCRADDTSVQEVCSHLNHTATALATSMERSFLRTLEGGCSMPIAALAIVEESSIHFRGSVFTTDGKRKAEIDTSYLQTSLEQGTEFGAKAAEEILANGGRDIISKFQ